MYYEKDPEFFLRVIKKEEAPFEFKIHLFQSLNSDGSSQSDERTQKTTMMDYLQ